jgi:hypothetical protein
VRGRGSEEGPADELLAQELRSAVRSQRGPRPWATQARYQTAGGIRGRMQRTVAAGLAAAAVLAGGSYGVLAGNVAPAPGGLVRQLLLRARWPEPPTRVPRATATGGASAEPVLTPQSKRLGAAPGVSTESRPLAPGTAAVPASATSPKPARGSKAASSPKPTSSPRPHAGAGDGADDRSKPTG